MRERTLVSWRLLSLALTIPACAGQGLNAPSDAGASGGNDQAMALAGLSLPGFLDRPDQAAAGAYAAWPARLVVVGADGRILRDFGSVVWQGWSWDEVARTLARECDRGAGASAGPL